MNMGQISREVKRVNKGPNKRYLQLKGRRDYYHAGRDTGEDQGGGLMAEVTKLIP
jgi:hypothetical protein